MTHSLLRFKYQGCVVLGILLLLSCKKADNTSPSYYLHYKANGIIVNCGINTAYFNYTSCDIEGCDSLHCIDINIVDDSGIKDTTYSGQPAYSGYRVGVEMSYSLVNSTGYTSGTSLDSAVVKFVEITDKYVKGTFTSKFDSSGITKIDMTDGEFLLPR